MGSKNSLILSDYSPNSELEVDRHIVEKPRYPVIDIHYHFDPYIDESEIEKSVELLKQHGYIHAVNLNGFSDLILKKTFSVIEKYEDFFITFGSIDVTRLDDGDFPQYVRNEMKKFKGLGLKGLKFFKDVSLKHKDTSDRYIPVDDQRLKVIWETASEFELPVLIHIADPVAFFKPLGRHNERYEELENHPDWHFGGAEYFTFQKLMEMQENLLFQNPDTVFIVAHVGSYPENLKFVSRCLDTYKNMHIDMAARLAELGRQPYTARKFLTDYQDRIMFGTDDYPLYTTSTYYYRFLETYDEYFEYSPSVIPDQGRWRIYGVSLDSGALEKIYFKNAKRILRLE